MFNAYLMLISLLEVIFFQILFSDLSGEQTQGLIFSQAVAAHFPAGNPSFPPSTSFSTPVRDTPLSENSVQLVDEDGSDTFIYNLGNMKEEEFNGVGEESEDVDNSPCPSPGTIPPVNTIS